MLDPAIKSIVERAILPAGYAWGPWRGDYRVIESNGREVCRVGGLLARVGADMNNEVLRAIYKGERELAR